MTIDWWTLGLQTVNVAILVWLLKRFFWHPVAAAIAQRGAETARQLAEAAATRDTAAAALADIAQTRAGFAAERDTLLAEARAAAERAAAARLDQAARDAAGLQDAARQEAARAQAEAEASWTDRASRLAVDIAGHLAARLDGPAVRDAFLRWLVEGIRALPAPVRASVAEPGARLSAITAAPLDPAAQEACRAAIRAAFAAAPDIDFAADPALIAGIELQGAQFSIANSWRADLARILARLAHDDHA